MTKTRGRKPSLSLYLLYSWGLTIFWCILDLSPNVVRVPIFRMMMERFGKESFIDYKTFIRYPWKVSIGNRVAVNRSCEFYPSLATAEGRIVLHDGVVLGPAVKMFAATHDYSHLDLPDTSAPIIVEKFAWIGGGAIILPGVTIGEGAVIGAGSVVTRNIEAYTVNAGNPARLIKRRDLHDQ
ncbi:acyltransferase [Pseudorhizobium pelagicum]|uniref:acyltransferase n=1 Tax=Pseudorhizobium pelagicum TaxID=1509405 RepID=UPI0006917F16|nr:acyltransferase [Pseudorhizobium pelagicum]